MNRIKIVHILNTLCVGGMELSVVGLCNLLDPTIYDVTLLVLSNSDMALGGRVAPHVKVISLPLKHRAISFFDSILLGLWIPIISAIFRRIKPDIIHTHIYQYNSIPVLISIRCCARRAKHFHTIHNTGIHYENLTVRHSKKLKMESYFYSLCRTNLVCVSKSVERNANDILSGYSSIRVISNGVDTSKFDRSRFAIKNDKELKLVYVSRLFEGKNHVTLLRAMTILAQRHTDIHLTLVGDGALRDSLESYVIKNNLSKNVEFLGNRNNVAEILSGMDVGVFPSENEADSVALIEKLAMGLAMVCSNIQVFRDKFERQDDALFFDVFDYESLAKNIEILYVDRIRLKNLQTRAYENSRQFTVQNMVSEYNDFYSLILDS